MPSGAAEPRLTGSAAARADLDLLLRAIARSEAEVEGYAELVEGGRRLREAGMGRPWAA